MAKKSFTGISNPAERFISMPEVEERTVAPTAEPEPETMLPMSGKVTPPKGYKLNPEYIETKSRRLQLLIKPSIHEAIKERATALGVSTNDLINTILQAYINKE